MSFIKLIARWCTLNHKNILQCVCIYISIYTHTHTHTATTLPHHLTYHFSDISVIKWLGLVSLFNGISTFVGLFNAKAILLEEQLWCYLTHSWEDKGVHTFPKGICPKVNVIARLEYKLAYYDSAVYCFNHYTMRTPPHKMAS